MNKNTKDIEDIKDSLLNGDIYGLLVIEDGQEGAVKYENIHKILDVVRFSDGDVIISYKDNSTGEEKMMSCDEDMYKRFMLIPMLGEIDGEAVYAGQKTFYKGVELAITYQDGDYVYFLNIYTENLFRVREDKFVELYKSGVIKILKEYSYKNSKSEDGKREAALGLSNVLSNVLESKQEQLRVPVPEKCCINYNEEDKELHYALEKLSSVDFIKNSQGDYFYLCRDKKIGDYDIITVAFAGVDVTGLEYSRYTVTENELIHLFKNGILSLCDKEEILHYISGVLYGREDD